MQLVGKEVGSTGYGLMGLTWRPQPQSEEESFKAMKASLEAGCNFWNAGEFYGTPEYNSLHLLNRYFTKYPEDAEKVVLSVKGGLKNWSPDGSPEGIERSVGNCLRLLDGKKKIDIFECARVDKNTPIETTMEALNECIKAGKIGGIGLSEVGAATIKKAAKVAKISAVEVEVSFWATEPFSNGVAEACAENNIPIVAYSPIGRGFLTGEITKPEDLAEGDLRRHMPRFQAGAFEKNMELVHKLQDIAKEKSCTPAQLAISWVRHLSKKNGNPEIIPIPGATKVDRVFENAKDIELNSKDAEAIDMILKTFEPTGGRYPDSHSSHLEG